MDGSLITRARQDAGLSGAELARRAGTSRPTLSAYEHGRVSPTLATVQRVLEATGHRLEAVAQPRWMQVPVGRGRIAWVPDRLPRLTPSEAFRTRQLPLHLDWSSPNRVVSFGDRRERHRAYEVLLREGRPVDIGTMLDGALLVDGWDELVLPVVLRAGWQPLIAAVTDDG